MHAGGSGSGRSRRGCGRGAVAVLVVIIAWSAVIALTLAGVALLSTLPGSASSPAASPWS